MAAFRSNFLSLFSGGIFPDKKWWLSCFCLSHKSDERPTRQSSVQKERMIYMIQVNEDEEHQEDYLVTDTTSPVLTQGHLYSGIPTSSRQDGVRGSREFMEENENQKRALAAQEGPLTNGCQLLLMDQHSYHQKLASRSIVDAQIGLNIAADKEVAKKALSKNVEAFTNDTVKSSSDNSVELIENNGLFLTAQTPADVLGVKSVSDLSCSERTVSGVNISVTLTEACTTAECKETVSTSGAENVAENESLSAPRSTSKSVNTSSASEVALSNNKGSNCAKNAHRTGDQRALVISIPTSFELSAKNHISLEDTSEKLDVTTTFMQGHATVDNEISVEISAQSADTKDSVKESNTLSHSIASSQSANFVVEYLKNSFLDSVISLQSSTTSNSIRSNETGSIASIADFELRNGVIIDDRTELNDHTYYSVSQTVSSQAIDHQIGNNSTEEKNKTCDVIEGELDSVADFSSEGLDTSEFKNELNLINNLSVSEDTISRTGSLNGRRTDFSCADNETDDFIINDTVKQPRLFETEERIEQAAEQSKGCHQDLGNSVIKCEKSLANGFLVSSQDDNFLLSDDDQYSSVLRGKILLQSNSYELLEHLAAGQAEYLLEESLEKVMEVKRRRHQGHSSLDVAVPGRLVQPNTTNSAGDLWYSEGKILPLENLDPFLTYQYEDINTERALVDLTLMDQFFSSEEWLDDDFGFSSLVTEVKPPPPYPDRLTEQQQQCQYMDLGVDQMSPPDISSFDIQLSPERIFPFVDQATDAFWFNRRYGESWDNVKPPETYFTVEDQLNSLDDCSRKSHKMFLFDLVAEILKEIYVEELNEVTYPWQKLNRFNPKMLEDPPTTIDVLKPLVHRQVLQCLGMQEELGSVSSSSSSSSSSTTTAAADVMKRSPWGAHHKKDLVDRMLIREMYLEEGRWTDYSEDANVIKNRVANKIFQSLIDDTAQAFKTLHSNCSSSADNICL